MPTYTLKCQKCEHVEDDVFFSFKDDIKLDCPKCGNPMHNTSFGGIGPLIKSGKTFIGDLWAKHEKMTGMPQPGTPGYEKMCKEQIKKEQKKFTDSQFDNKKRKKKR